MNTNDEYKIIISGIVKDQSLFLGKVVLQIARSVSGLEVSNDMEVTNLLRSAEAVVAELNEKMFHLTGWSKVPVDETLASSSPAVS